MHSILMLELKKICCLGLSKKYTRGCEAHLVTGDLRAPGPPGRGATIEKIKKIVLDNSLKYLQPILKQIEAVLIP